MFPGLNLNFDNNEQSFEIENLSEDYIPNNDYADKYLTSNKSCLQDQKEIIINFLESQNPSRKVNKLISIIQNLKFYTPSETKNIISGISSYGTFEIINDGDVKTFVKKTNLFQDICHKLNDINNNEDEVIKSIHNLLIKCEKMNSLLTTSRELFPNNFINMSLCHIRVNDITHQIDHIMNLDFVDYAIPLQDFFINQSSPPFPLYIVELQLLYIMRTLNQKQIFHNDFAVRNIMITYVKSQICYNVNDHFMIKITARNKGFVPVPVIIDYDFMNTTFDNKISQFQAKDKDLGDYMDSISEEIKLANCSDVQYTNSCTLLSEMNALIKLNKIEKLSKLINNLNNQNQQESPQHIHNFIQHVNESKQNKNTFVNNIKRLKNIENYDMSNMEKDVELLFGLGYDIEIVKKCASTTCRNTKCSLPSKSCFYHR
jgi:hypothetical protein